MNLLSKHKQHRKLTTLVENITTYNTNYAELNIFETYSAAEKVSLIFDFPIIASMLTGKKIMHLEGFESFEFFPGESVIMPEKKEMLIDFPSACQNAPTQCLALGIDADKIEEITAKFNEELVLEGQDWQLEETSSHLINNKEVNHLIERLTYTFTNDNKSKDILVDLMIQELIIRLLQTKAKSLIVANKKGRFSNTRVGAAIKYIKDNLTNKDITVDVLAKKTYMSKSHFHKLFKTTIGVSPIDYINAEKIKFAKKMMQESKDYKISEIAYKSGFNSISYFNRQFKKMELMTPQQYKSLLKK